MPVSHYFNNYSAVATNEIRLMEDVVHESIGIMGHNCYYLPREHFNENDFIFGENVTSKFDRAYLMAFYLTNVQGYEGDGDFFSKFGLEIRDTSNFVISRREFEKYVPSVIATRPREGDLIYVPGIQKLFEVKFIEEELMFFSLGNRNPYIYELRAEMFRFSHEDIKTGVSEVDNIAVHTEYTIKLNLSGGSNNYFIGETVYQGANLNYSTARAEVKDWDKSANSIYLINIVGDFSTTGNLTGVTSNTKYAISATDTLGDYIDYDLFNNKDLKDEANNYIDLSEKNPFGIP